MSILQDLLSIKTFRERRAELAVHKQRNVLAHAEQRRDLAQDRLEEFKVYAWSREQELFADLCSRMVQVRDIQDVHVTVSVLRTQERDFEGTLEKAEEVRQAESQALEAFKLAHREAARLKEKFLELAENHAQEKLRIAERREDAEMEEIAEIRRDRAEWQEAVEDET